MKFIKKNQVIVAVIGLMLITAGYLNFTNNTSANQAIEAGVLTDAIDMAEIGDAQLVSSVPTNSNTTNSNTNIQNTTNTEITNTDIVKNENNDEYFTKSRLERETMYSQMLEGYQKILENTNVSESQKKIAQKEISTINEKKNAIMIAENLIKTKGLDDLVIFINDKSINIIVKSKKIKTKQVAQIQNIVTRELKADITNIHITNKE